MAEVEAGQDIAQEPQEEVVEQPKPQQRTYSQEEVDRIAQKIRKNARYLGRKEAESELLRQGATPVQARAAAEKPAVEKEPAREDHDDYESWRDAVTEYRARKATREENALIEREREQKSEDERAVKAASEFKKHANALIEEIPDFSEVIEDAQDVKISRAMAREMEDAGALGPRMLYELAKNPDEAARIAALPVNQQIREMAKMQSRMEGEAKTKAAAKKGPAEDKGEEKEEEGEVEGEKREEAQVKAEEGERNADGTFKPKKKSPPEPIEPGTGRNANTSQLPSDKDDPDTWLRKRNAQIEREGRP